MCVCCLCVFHLHAWLTTDVGVLTSPTHSGSAKRVDRISTRAYLFNRLTAPELPQ